MKRKLIVVLTVVLCAVFVGSTVFVALFAGSTGQETPDAAGVTPPLDASSSVEALASYSSSMPNTIFYQSTLNAHSGSWPWQCSSAIVDDYVRITVSGNDPYYTVTTGIEYKAGNYAAIYYSTSNATGCSTQFYMGPSGSPNEGEMRKVALTVDGQWHQAIVDISSIVSSTKTARYLRFDPLHSDSGVIPSDAVISVKYIAFFDTKADAEVFDFDEYLRYVNGELNDDVDWPAPTYQEKTDVTSADTSAGTLKYTPSADGSKVTISYTTDTKTHSYTVPDDNNYLFGGFAGTDDVDRTLHDSSEVGIVGENGEKYVGIFYFLWHGDWSVQNGSNALYDLQKIIDENGIEKAGKVSSGLYGAIGTVHWFAEPLYGYYHNDPWVMRKHAELLCNAGVDFLYFDVSNGFDYSSQAINMMSILHSLNEQGYDAPQVVFYTNSASNTVVTNLYNNIYSQNLYPDTWFRINGKPVIIATERSDSLRQSGSFSSTIKNFFTIKESQWPQEAQQTNGWPWMDWSWPQKVYTNASGGERTMNISIAQHNNSTIFSTSSLYGNYNNRGRSYGSTAAQIASWSSSLGTQYGNLYEADKSMTNQGYNFQAQWDHAINSNVQYALVTGWNEWIAQRWQGDVHLGNADNVVFVDAASMEFSRDAEMMRGGYFDNYYMQLIYNIERFKGDAPVVLQDSRKPINVTGEFNQWNSVLVSYTDPSGDTVNRDGKGYGDKTYTNDTGRNDIVSAKITHDTKNIYFYAQTKSTVSMYDTNSSWMQLYIDIDRNADTGWYGYDYIVNYKASGYFTTSVAKYTGTNGAYGFTSIGTVSYRASGNEMMIQVPFELLGISSYSNINMEFKWADSDTTYTTMEQFYTDGDAAPLGRLNYVYQTYIEGEQSGSGSETHTCSFGAWTTTTAATCTKAGTETRTCSCGASETQTIPAKGHTEVTVSGYAATCTANGKTDGKKCSVCNTVTVAQTVIPAVGHKEITVGATAATCTNAGKTEGKQCSVCGVFTVTQATIPAKGHTEVTVPAVSVTCTQSGLTAGTKCADCGLTLITQAVIPAQGHTEVTVPTVPATCTTAGKTEGKRCSICNTTTVAQTTIPAKGHTEVTVSGTAATCTESGLTDGKRCTTCNTTTVAQTSIPAKGHTEVTVSGTAATCTESGLTDGKMCTTCNTTTVAQTTIPAKGHKEVTVAGILPTCTDSGISDSVTCSTCNATLIAQTIVPATGHDELPLTGKAPTCTTTGLSDGVQCKTCGVVLERQTILPATSHTAGDWIMDYEPTTEGAGQKHTECTVCGATVSIETIPALPDPDEEETEPESTDIPSDTDVDTAPAESEPVTDPVTSHASDETTEGEPTDETTDEAPSPDTTAPTGGCGAVITSVALITFMAAGVATVCTRKKKD